MWPIFKTKMFIFHSKANFDEKILFVKITYLEAPKIRKIALKGLYRNRDIHVPLSMIYVTLKFKFNAIVNFRKRISISIISSK